MFINVADATSMLDTRLLRREFKWPEDPYLTVLALWLRFIDNLDDALASDIFSDADSDTLLRAFLELYPLYNNAFIVENVDYS